MNTAHRLLWVLLLTSCSDPTGAKYSFTAQGSGPEGKHLHSPRIGQAAVGFVIDGSRELKAGRALRTHFFHNEITESSLETEVGLFSTSSTVKGEFPNPHLMVPATVRVGMKWEVFGADGKADFLFEVTAREENVLTIYGRGTVWTIVQTFSLGTVERHYLEGVGRLDFNAEVWPLEAQDVERPATKSLTMTELTLPESLKFTQDAPWIDGLALVRPDPAGPALITVFGSFDETAYAAAFAPSACVKLEGGQLEPVTATSGTACRRTTGLTCPSAPYCVPVPGVGTQGAICPELVLHGNGARVADDGSVTWLARKWTGQFAQTGAGGFGPEDSVVKAGGGVFPMIAMPRPDGTMDGLSLERRDTGTIGLPNQFGQQAPPDPSYYFRPEHSFPNDERERKPIYDQVVDLGVDAQGRQQLLMRDLESTLFWSRLEGNRFTHPRVVGRLSGRLSVQARRGGNDVLRITGDGSVDRFVVRDDEVKLEHLADVAIPPTHTAIGAFVDGERLLIATIGNGTPDLRGNTVRLHLFHTGAIGAGEVVRIPQALTLTVRALLGHSGETNAVCWRPTGSPIDLSTWTINELTPDLRLEVSAGDQCVLLGFDTRQGANKLERIAGVVPGVGRVFFRGKPQATSGTGYAGVLVGQEPVAVLSDGSLSTVRRRYTRGGFDMGLPDRLNSPFTSLKPYLVPDLGGAGLWVRDFAADGGFSVELKGTTTRLFAEAHNQVPSHALLPTGLMTTAGWVLSPDGGIEKPTPNGRGLFCQRASNGDWCGASMGSPRELFCEGNDGGTRTVPNPVAIQACANWLPRGDGTWLLFGGQKMFTFDPIAMTLTEDGDADVLGQGIDHKGRGLFAKHIWGTAKHTIHLATAGIPEAFTVPDSYWTAGGNTPNGLEFVSTPDVTFMSITWTGVNGTADPTTFRMTPVP